MKKFIAEFKDFAVKGNVFDMAIGVVMGGAFTAIVTSLVSDIITPLISLLTNSENLEKLERVLKPAVIVDGTVVKEATVLRYGQFIDSIISFVIIAFVIFMAIKALNKLMKSKEDPIEDLVEEQAEEVILLQKIYDELKSNKNVEN